MKAKSVTANSERQPHMVKKNRPSYKFLYNLRMYKYYYIILIPAIVWYIVFCYYPMYGVVIAFQNYRFADGILGSKFIGFSNFARLFRGTGFVEVMRNTVKISLLRLIFGFPAPIILALLFNLNSASIWTYTN